MKKTLSNNSEHSHERGRMRPPCLRPSGPSSPTSAGLFLPATPTHRSFALRAQIWETDLAKG